MHQNQARDTFLNSAKRDIWAVRACETCRFFLYLWFSLRDFFAKQCRFQQTPRILTVTAGCNSKIPFLKFSERTPQLTFKAANLGVFKAQIKTILYTRLSKAKAHCCQPFCFDLRKFIDWCSFQVILDHGQRHSLNKSNVSEWQRNSKSQLQIEQLHGWRVTPHMSRANCYRRLWHSNFPVSTN